MCGGRALTVPLLRRLVPASQLRELWTLLRAGTPDSDACPSCTRPMRDVVFQADGGRLHVDGCVQCHLLWFDEDELAAFAPCPESPGPVLDAPVPADASDGWTWGTFFRRINEKHFGGPTGLL